MASSPDALSESSGLKTPLSSLLATKLYVPKLRREFVPRLQLRFTLFERLNAGLVCKLTLLSAPAGFGKTTLAAEWLQQSAIDNSRFAWLSLDKADNDPTRFLTYFIAALRNVEAGFGEAALAWLQSANQSPSESVWTGLINEITSFSKEMVLILDDFHLITASDIHDALTFLLDNQPPHLHLFLITRADPPWPLARLRSQHELNEIRVGELRFTVEETAVFLNQIMQLNLSPDELTTLDEQTEGWIAGLQMAALSMKGRTDTAGFIKAFAGSHRYILDYLVEEVLEQQPADIQKFLLKSSILDQLTAPLCQIVTGREDSQMLLAQLEQDNLFIVSLDDERCWYRYHHLFADLLQNRLEQTFPELVPQLHMLASDWYEQAGYLMDAVGHGLAANNVEHVANLVEGKALSMMGHGGLTTLLQWLTVLPDEVIETRPWLSVTHAWALVYTGQIDAVDAPVRHVEQALSRMSDDNDDEHNHISGHLAALRAYVAELKGDMQRAYDMAYKAQTLLPEDALMARGSAATVLGSALRWLGDFPGAIHAFTEARAILNDIGDNHISMFIQCGLARLYTLQGKLHKSMKMYQDILASFAKDTQPGRQKSPHMGHTHTRISQIYLEWNNLEAALSHAQEGVARSEQWGQADVLIYGYANLARAQQANGNVGAANSAIRQAKELAEGMSPWFENYVSAWETRLYLARGDVHAAVRWVEENGFSIHDQISYRNEPVYYTVARVMVAQALVNSEKRLIVDAQFLLDRLWTLVEAAGMTLRMIDLLVLQMLCFQMLDENNKALRLLKQGLMLAELECYQYSFIEAGAPMRKLLQRVNGKEGQSDFVNTLLVAMGDLWCGDGEETAVSPSLLLDPLSPRELDVLRLLNTQLSSTEIANQLYVAPSTVRSHIKNIYSKLNVHRRADAVKQAESLNLL